MSDLFTTEPPRLVVLREQRLGATLDRIFAVHP